MCYTTADNNHLGIEQIDQAGNGNSKITARTCQNLLGNQVAAPCGQGHILRRDTFQRFDICQLRAFPPLHRFLCLQGDGFATRQGFQAAMVTARTQWTIVLNGQVANLPCSAGCPMIDFSIQQQAGPYARTHFDEHQVLLTARRTIRPLA